LYANAALLDRDSPFCDLTLNEFGEIFWGRLIVGNDFGAKGPEPIVHRRRMHRHKCRISAASCNVLIGSGAPFGKKMAFQV
jgi:hypothetical protein